MASSIHVQSEDHAQIYSTFYTRKAVACGVYLTILNHYCHC